MPTLDWIGKQAVVNHDKEVPYRLLHCDPKQSAGNPDTGNLIVQGDNLNALKALLPYYAGKVKCIYIDPPYNTGNEGWVYNDNVNAPEIKQWLGKTVGKEAEDLSRHDKWLCMMYPRLKLLKEFLSEDGVIFVSIDDNELQHLRLILDDVFRGSNFVSNVIWQKIFSTKNSARQFSDSHDHVVVYAKSAATWIPNPLPRTEAQDKRYKNPDNDPRGPWTSGDCSARNFYGDGTYAITCPSGRVIAGPPKGMYWRFSKEKFAQLDEENRIWWGKNGNNVPRLKRFLSEVKGGTTPDTIWLHKQVGNTQEAKKELLAHIEFEDSRSVFITPKPTRLIKRILQIATDPDSLILDSFAGSGTTMHAVMQLNREDGGNRRCIMVEMEQDIATKVTAERIRRVMEQEAPGKREDEGFRYCTLGDPLFAADGTIADKVKYRDLAHHIFFTETGRPLPKSRNVRGPHLGDDGDPAAGGRSIYLLYNGVMGDKTVDGGNVLTRKTLAKCGGDTAGSGPRVIYGEGCRLSDATLRRLGVTFKQLPYDLKVS